MPLGEYLLLFLGINRTGGAHGRCGSGDWSSFRRLLWSVCLESALCAGVLEWVEGTVPLGQNLLGSNRTGGAHGRYGAGDWLVLMCPLWCLCLESGHCAGVLEWVEGTVPLGEYLLGSNRTGGAHGRYGAGDWSFPKCREEMQNAKDKRGAFETVCAHFHPVMHHFFLERFLKPPQWFERRLTYTRSIATSSMVCRPSFPTLNP